MRNKTEEEIEIEEKRKVAEEAVKNTPKVHVLAGLPEYLKDPANYMKVKKALLETLASKHSHGEMSEWANCVQCQSKMHDHGMMMRSLGFTSAQQYMAWDKIHRKIEEYQKMKLR